MTDNTTEWFMGRTTHFLSGRVMMLVPSEYTPVYHLGCRIESQHRDKGNVVSTVCKIENHRSDIKLFDATLVDLSRKRPCKKCISRKRKIIDHFREQVPRPKNSLKIELPIQEY